MPELPPPLPPERRTVGQLVAESIRAYQQSFWRCLPLGLPLAVADQLSVRQVPAHCHRARRSDPQWLFGQEMAAQVQGAQQQPVIRHTQRLLIEANRPRLHACSRAAPTGRATTAKPRTGASSRARAANRLSGA